VAVEVGGGATLPAMSERPSPPASTSGLTPERRRTIERWFVQRGVPQLIEGFSEEAQMDARAAPYIAAWLALGTVLYWGTRPAWPLALNVAGVIGCLAFIITGYGLLRWARGRRVGSWVGRFDLVDIGAFAVLPAVASAVIEGSVGELLIATLNALLGIGVIYVAVIFGLVEITIWAGGRLREQLTSIVGLVARTLPLLLILVAFLLFSAEIWEAGHALEPAELLAVIVLLGIVASLLVVTTARAEVGRLEGRPWQTIVADAVATPAASLATELTDETPRPPRLTWLQRSNVISLMLVNQLLQSAFVAIVVMVFLVIFGILVLPEAVQERWVGEQVRTALAFELLGERRTVSAELLNVTALLSGIVGLYFTGQAVAEPGHREEHFAHVVAEVGELLAARAVYGAAVKRDADRLLDGPVSVSAGSSGGA
jgi:hypothetical protein